MSKKAFLIFSLVFLFIIEGHCQQEKAMPAQLEAPIKEALSYFPELESYTIDFKFRKKLKNRVMQAQPKIKSLLRAKAKRQYKISMAMNLVMQDTTMTLLQLPHDILVGWFAHELGHIMDYKDRSSINLIGFGFNYLTSTPFLKKSEKRADLLAANNGCAQDLIKTKRFILFNSKFTKEYKAKIKELYPSPDEIIALLQQ